MATEDTIQTQTAGGAGSKGGVKGFRTFETDIADYAKGKNLSLVDIAAEEAKFRGAGFEMEDEAPSSGRKLVVIFMAVFVLLGVIGGGYFVFTKKFFNGKFGSSAKTAGGLHLSEPPILADDKVEIAANEERKEIFLKDLKSVLSGGESGKLFSILPVKYAGENKKVVSAKEFFSLIKANAPAELTDYLNSNFMLLKLDADGGHTALVFRVSSYEYAFSAMMNWESGIFWELKNVFLVGQTFEAGRAFSDKFTQNHDTRVLLDGDGKTRLAYSFINRKYLVIAEDEKILAEIFSRFDSSRYANPTATW